MRQVFHADHDGSLAPFDYERARLAEAGAELAVAPCAGRDELIKAAADAEVIWLAWAPPIDGPMMEGLPKCRLIIRWGAGYDQIDVEAATRTGIAVANAPRHGTENVAEHAIALLLAMARSVVTDHTFIVRGGWRDPSVPRQRLAGHTLGVVGLGRIGRRVAELGLAFGCRVIAYAPRPDVVVPDGVTLVSLAELMSSADYVSVHAALNQGSRRLIDASLLAAARPGLLLVNTSRGQLIDHDALLAAIDNGVVAGAALDVFDTEPLPADSPLRACPAVILTPHAGASSTEVMTDLRAEMCDTTIQWLTTGWADAVVNPAVAGWLRQGGPT